MTTESEGVSWNKGNEEDFRLFCRQSEDPTSFPSSFNFLFLDVVFYLYRRSTRPSIPGCLRDSGRIRVSPCLLVDSKDVGQIPVWNRYWKSIFARGFLNQQCDPFSYPFPSEDFNFLK